MIKFKMKSISRLLACSCFLLLTTACTSSNLIQALQLEKPEIHFIDYKIKNVNAKQVNLVLNFNVSNPNKIGLKNVFIDYELFTEGHKIVAGHESDMVLVPSGDSVVQVPAEMAYADLAKVLGPVAEHVLRQDKTLPVDAHVTIYGKPTIYSGFGIDDFFAFNYSTTRHLEVPLPQDKIDNALEKLRNKLKNLGQ